MTAVTGTLDHTPVTDRPDTGTPSPAGPSPVADVAAWATGRAGRYLTFTLRGEMYALEILEVSEIIEFRALTVVPMMPAFIRGVINLRGRVLPVIDIAARFRQPATEVARRTSIVVVETNGLPHVTTSTITANNQQGIGIVVDAVNKVVHLGEDDIVPPPTFGAGIRSDFISGMAKHKDGFIIVLDMAKVLSMDDMGLLAQVAPVKAEMPGDAVGTPPGIDSER